MPLPLLLASLLALGPGGEEPSEQVRVVLSPEAAQMRPTLEGLLGGFDVALAWEDAEQIDPRARLDRELDTIELWIETEAGSTLVYVVDGRHGRVLLRHLDTPEGLSAVEREEIGQLVESSVEALLAGAEIGLTRAELESSLEPEPEPEAEPILEAEAEASPSRTPDAPERGAWTLDTAALGRGYGLGDGAVLFDLGLWFAATRELGEQLGLGLGVEAAALLPHTLPVPPQSTLDVEFVGAQATALARLRVDVAKVYLPVELGAGLELRHTEITALAAQADPGDPGSSSSRASRCGQVSARGSASATPWCSSSSSLSISACVRSATSLRTARCCSSRGRRGRASWSSWAGPAALFELCFAPTAAGCHVTQREAEAARCVAGMTRGVFIQLVTVKVRRRKGNPVQNGVFRPFRRFNGDRSLVCRDSFRAND